MIKSIHHSVVYFPLGTDSTRVWLAELSQNNHTRNITLLCSLINIIQHISSDFRHAKPAITLSGVVTNLSLFLIGWGRFRTLRLYVPYSLSGWNCSLITSAIQLKLGPYTLWALTLVLKECFWDMIISTEHRNVKGIFQPRRYLHMAPFLFTGGMNLSLHSHKCFHWFPLNRCT